MTTIESPAAAAQGADPAVVLPETRRGATWLTIPAADMAPRARRLGSWPKERVESAVALTADSLELAARLALVAADSAVTAISQAAEQAGFTGIADAKEASWQVLSHRQFRRYFAASLVSNAGTWSQNLAQMLMAYQIRHSVFTVGLVTCAQFSSPLLLGPWAGVVADRIGSRRTLLATQIASTVITAILAVMAFAHSLGEGPLLVGAFTTGLMFTFALPAQSVIIPSLLPLAEGTKAAMAMNSVSYNAGRALAPALGVLIVTTIGFGWAFTANAVSFAIFTAVLLRLRPCRDLPIPIRSRVRDGFHIAWKERKIMLLLVMVAMITFADDPILVLGPALARHVGMSDDYSGYFLSALGAGSVLGALLPRRKSPSARRAAAALALLGVSIMVFALAPWLWVSIGAAFAAGVSGLVAGSAAQAILVGLAGSQRALRIMGLWTMAWAGSKPIASIIDGTLPSLTSVRITGVILAFPTVIPILMLIFCPALTRRLVGPGAEATSGPAERNRAAELMQRPGRETCQVVS